MVTALVIFHHVGHGYVITNLNVVVAIPLVTAVGKERIN